MQGQDIGIIDEREAVIPCVRYIPIRGNLCEKPGEKKNRHCFTLCITETTHHNSCLIPEIQFLPPASLKIGFEELIECPHVVLLGELEVVGNVLHDLAHQG